MRSIRRLGKSVRIIVEHPDGGLLSLPANETSLELTPPRVAVKGQLPLFEPKKLWQLTKCVQLICDTTPPKALKIQQQKIGTKKVDDQTAQTPCSWQHGIRGTHETLDLSDGAVSCQNARLGTGKGKRGKSN